MKKIKVLVTGSSGYLGNEISLLLNSSGNYETVGFDLQPGNCTHLTGSLTNWETVKEITKGIDMIVHTASLHAPHVQAHPREKFVDTNIKGTLYLLEAALLNNVQKLVYTSTTSLYGNSLVDEQKAVWVTEELPTLPRDIYDITKIAAENLCQDFFDSDRLQTSSLRVSRFWKEPIVDKVFYRMYRGLDVRDAAFAHKLVLDQNLEAFEAFNISAQSIFSEEDVQALKNDLEPLLSQRVPLLAGVYRSKNWALPNEIDRVYVIDKARRMLGYQPRYNIKELIEEVSAMI